MTNKDPLLQAHQIPPHKGRPPLQKRILILVTCLGMMAVVGTQYFSLANSNSVSPMLSTKEDFMSGLVVEFRSAAATNDGEKEVTADNKKEVIADNEHEETANREPGLDYNGTPLHLVFSTSCSDQMHWESYVFFYHAWKVGQPGTVTRIASGCKDSEAEAAKKFHEESIKTMSDRFYLHLTPDFSKQRLGEGKGSYKYMNKPFGLLDYLKNFLQMGSENRPEGVEDGVIILMDPDMVLKRPLLHDFSNEDVIWAEEKPATRMVKHGYPMAQQDGYLDNKWMHNINGTFVTGDPNIGRPKDREGPLHWNTGPPYLATVKDMYEISLLWVDYAPLVDHVNPGLFAEMQGFIWATYKLNLPHTLIKSLVVSTTETPHREGWAYIDNLPDNEVCRPSKDTPLPVGLHYCKRYALGPDFFFSKYRLKKNILDCDKNLLMPPPKDIHTMYDYFIAPPPADGKPKKNPEKKIFSKRQTKREAFMLCGMIDAVNEAVAYYKTHNCGEDANLNEVYTIKNDPGRY